jgi:hypothetical protein
MNYYYYFCKRFALLVRAPNYHSRTRLDALEIS